MFQGFDSIIKMINEAAIEYEEYRSEYEKMKNSKTPSETKEKPDINDKKPSTGLTSVRRAIR